MTVTIKNVEVVNDDMVRKAIIGEEKKCEHEYFSAWRMNCCRKCGKNVSVEDCLAAQAKQHETEKIRINMIQCKKLAELADKLIEKHNAEKKQIFAEIERISDFGIMNGYMRQKASDFTALKKKWCKE